MSYPNAVTTFAAVVDGTTKIIDDLWNLIHTDVEAVETFIGAIGSTQANSDSIKNLLSSYRRGCYVEYKGAADLYVRSGELAIPDAGGNLRFRKNTSDTTVTWADIDAGAEANSTVYYAYAIADAAGTTFTVKISINSATPAGCTFYKKLGSFYNNSAGNIDSQRVVGRLELTDQPQVKFRTGTYTGDGAATLAITGLGFPPRYLEIYPQQSSQAGPFKKSDQDGTKAHYDQSAAIYYEDDYIVSLDADGFTVGDGTGGSSVSHVNRNGVTFTYRAWG